MFPLVNPHLSFATCLSLWILNSSLGCDKVSDVIFTVCVYCSEMVTTGGGDIGPEAHVSSTTSHMESEEEPNGNGGLETIVEANLEKVWQIHFSYHVSQVHSKTAQHSYRDPGC